MGPAGLPVEERKMILDLLSQVRQRMLSPERIRTCDEEETFPEDVIRELLGPNIGLQLLFIPEEYGGLGGGARDIAAVSEEMAKICLGVATGFLAIHLGTDPILVGATDAQKEKWLTELAEGARYRRLRGHRAGGRKQSFRSEDFGHPGLGRSGHHHRIPHQRDQAVHLQRGLRRLS